MTGDGRSIRTLSPAEVETLVDWAAAEGWNPGLGDAAAFHACDPEGFLGAFVDGEMAAGIAAVAYGSDFGFIGLYICRPDMRGRGHGKAVWDAGMARLAGRTIGLDGVDAQLRNYRSMGFSAAYRTIRFGGKTTPDAGASIQPVTPALIPAIMAFDNAAFPAPRPIFLERWTAPPHQALATSKNGGITGYGVVRQCRQGSKIGGLFADGETEAEKLFAALAGGHIFIDVPEPRRRFIDAIATAGMTPVFETTRMYLGRPPSLSDKVFGVTTLELG